MGDNILRPSSEASVMLYNVMQKVEEEEQLRKNTEWQPKEAVSENISLKGSTRKHLSLLLEFPPTPLAML